MFHPRRESSDQPERTPFEWAFEGVTGSRDPDVRLGHFGFCAASSRQRLERPSGFGGWRSSCGEGRPNSGGIGSAFVPGVEGAEHSWGSAECGRSAARLRRGLLFINLRIRHGIRTRLSGSCRYGPEPCVRSGSQSQNRPTRFEPDAIEPKFYIAPILNGLR